MSEQTIRPGRYRHFKGAIYTVIGVARHTEGPTEFVIYRGEDGQLWARPRAIFIDLIHVVGDPMKPRFEFVDEARG